MKTQSCEPPINRLLRSTWKWVCHAMALILVVHVSFVIAEPDVRTQPSKQKKEVSDLQKRIDAANAGEVIQLAEGTIKGPITITKPLTLRGAGMDKTTIEVMGDYPA